MTVSTRQAIMAMSRLKPSGRIGSKLYKKLSNNFQTVLSFLLGCLE